MMCKGCGKELTDREATRKDPRDPNGSYLDLCGECYGSSERFVFENTDVPVRDKDVPVEALKSAFDTYVTKRMRKSWREDGLGLMDPQERETMLYNKYFSEFLSEYGVCGSVSSALIRVFNLSSRG